MNLKTKPLVITACLLIAVIAGTIWLFQKEQPLNSIHESSTGFTMSHGAYVGRGESKWQAYCDIKGVAKILVVSQQTTLHNEDRNTLTYKSHNGRSNLYLNNDRIPPADWPMLIVFSNGKLLSKQHVTQNFLTTEYNRLSSLRGEELYDPIQALVDQAQRHASMPAN